MSACDVCLRRAHVIATLASRIEGLLQRPGDRIANLLALPSDELVDALVPPDRMVVVGAALAAFDPEHAREQAADAGLDVLCRHAAGYPDALRATPDSPPVLWAKGGADRLSQLLDGPGVAIVGGRRPSAYGIEVAEELARGLSAAGVTVVSGLALGIDAAAHRGALRAPTARTIAVLGSGADVVYPKMNRRIYDQIANVGVILSESPPGRRPFRWTFPARNRIMAAITAMTVVVEAADPSGSLITASFAAELGRGVAAVPGRVTASNAAGSNRLLRDGAAVIRDAADALDELFGIGGAARLEAAATVDLTADERSVLEAVEAGDDPALHTGLDAQQVRAVLGILEARGLIRRSGIGSYERAA
ncbi:MAG: processing protein [Thermoleophilaceae bacterium]|jgi:DNA processing protein|nr:processing protein [Thermoleophilaceae bacterium]